MHNMYFLIGKFMRIKTALALVLTTVFFTSTSFAKSGSAAGALDADSLDKVQPRFKLPIKHQPRPQIKNRNNQF